MEILPVPHGCLAACLVGEILLKLLHIGTHIRRIGHILKVCITVQLYDILHKANQRLRVKKSVVAHDIHTLKIIWCLDNDNLVHRLILTKRNTRPRRHLGFCLLHGLPGEIHKVDLALLLVHDVLIPLLLLLVIDKPCTHGLTALICLVDCLAKLVHIQLKLDRETAADIENLFARTVVCIVKMILLCGRQWIGFKSVSCFHSFLLLWNYMISSKNSFNACSYFSVSL